MNKLILSTFSLVYIFFFDLPETHAQDSLRFPTPTGNPNQLFFLQRTQNTNTVVYELNMKDGVVDTTNPVHIFWICYAERSQKEELNGVQRKYAYGLTTKCLSKDHYELRFLANKKYAVELSKGPDNKYHVYGMISNKQAILSKIYLQIHGGTVFSPHIEYVILTGIDPDSGTEVFEKKNI